MTKLTKPQWDALDRICRTNGGGVAVRCKVNDDDVVVPIHKPTAALFAKGLIQGKAGGYEKVVHTREGLQLWRERQA